MFAIVKFMKPSYEGFLIENFPLKQKFVKRCSVSDLRILNCFSEPNYFCAVQSIKFFDIMISSNILIIMMLIYLPLSISVKLYSVLKYLYLTGWNNYINRTEQYFDDNNTLFYTIVVVLFYCYFQTKLWVFFQICTQCIHCIV